VGQEYGSELRPKRTAVVSLYTEPPTNGTTICTDELGPVTPRLHAPPPGWSPDGHRIKAPLEYCRGEDKVWFYGALRVCDVHALTLTAHARNTVGYLRLLKAINVDTPTGDLNLIADNLSSHKSPPIQAWLAEHPRVHQVFIPTKACWLNLVEGWWRLFRREALAGQDFCGAADLDEARRVATAQLNRRAKTWVWGRPPPKHRKLRRTFVYRL
jgi:transposase